MNIKTMRFRFNHECLQEFFGSIFENWCLSIFDEIVSIAVVTILMVSRAASVGKKTDTFLNIHETNQQSGWWNECFELISRSPYFLSCIEESMGETIGARNKEREREEVGGSFLR